MSPWRALERLPDWRVDWCWPPGQGRVIYDHKLIELRHDLTATAERCVLTHEIVHAERGPFPRWATAREEETVKREAARRLIPIRALADALAWSQLATEIADELSVDVETLQARLRGLHPAERAFLERVIDGD